MSSLTRDLLPASTTLPTDRQRLFVLFFTGTLIDLVVLGLFAEHASKVYVESFTTALLAAVVLQVLLKVTIVVGRRVLAPFRDKSGAAWALLRFLSAWIVLFGSKFVILETLTFAFGDGIRFEGALNGAVWLTLVVFAMVIAEDVVAKFYRTWLNDAVPPASIIPAQPLRDSAE